jgi:DNA polymerase I-like protein with 3'-5' exonuclease and polymerase domains
MSSTQLLTIDFETYYDKDYSLSKMTTEEYVRSDLFEVIGVAVKVNDGDVRWFTGTHQDIKEWLLQFAWDRSLVLAHNTMFDAAILVWQFGIIPLGWIDTMSMGQALLPATQSKSLAKLAEHYGVGVKGDEVIHANGKRKKDFSKAELQQYGLYCCNDVDLTYKLFGKMWPIFPRQELKLIDLTIRMFAEPVLRVDVDLLTKHLSQIREFKDKLLTASGLDTDTIMSNNKFADWLRERGVDPPMKVSPTTGKKTLAFAKTDKEFLALQDHEDVAVQTAVAARLGVKSTLEETRTERFIGIGTRGALPVPLKYYAAHTGRWGGSDSLNLQNLPSRTGSSALKNSICAPEDHVIIDADSSQIEARMLAWLAGQNDIVQAFATGQDVYRLMASEIYKRPPEEITKEQRFIGKTVILGCGYGMGAEKFKNMLSLQKISLEKHDAEFIIQVYRDRNFKIKQLWYEAQNALPTMLKNRNASLGQNNVLMVEGTKGIRLPSGLHVKYNNLRPTSDGGFEYEARKNEWVKIYGGKVIENVTQALARIVIGYQMLKIAERYRVVLTVHDAIACIAPIGEQHLAREYVESCMRTMPEWATGLPLDCESGVGANYGEC